MNQSTPLNQLTALAHALSDPNRVRMLAACLDQERCVCQLVELIDLSNASISKHLAVLKNAGLLQSRKEGRWVHYKLPGAPAPIVTQSLDMVRAHALRDELILNDTNRLTQIDAIDPTDLARMQRQGCCVPSNTPGSPSPSEHTPSP